MTTTTVHDDVVNSAERLAVRADLAGISNLSSSEQIIVRAWSAFGVICNGGFQYFYEGSTDTLTVADAFDALGFADAAQACRRSITLFPAFVIAGGYEQSREWMAQSNPTELAAHFSPLNHIIWELDDDDKLVHALAAYTDRTGQQT